MMPVNPSTVYCDRCGRSEYWGVMRVVLGDTLCPGCAVSVHAGIMARAGLVFGSAKERQCRVCDAGADHWHHLDYARPLWVIPLCRECHRLWHLLDSGCRFGEPLLGPRE